MAKLSTIRLDTLNRIIEAIDEFIPGIAQGAQLGSPLIELKTLQTSGYIEHFPWQVLATKNEDLFVKPSACLATYTKHQGATLRSSIEDFVCAPIYRTEAQSEPHAQRHNGFWMLEYVYIGTKNQVAEKAKELLGNTPKIFSSLAVKAEPVVATDAFYLEESEGSRLLQKMKQLKTEFVSGGNGVSLASLNKHEDYFGKKFAIMYDGTPAHSLCLAFGVDRLSAVMKEGNL